MKVNHINYINPQRFCSDVTKHSKHGVLHRPSRFTNIEKKNLPVAEELNFQERATKLLEDLKVFWINPSFDSSSKWSLLCAEFAILGNEFEELDSLYSKDRSRVIMLPEVYSNKSHLNIREFQEVRNTFQQASCLMNCIRWQLTWFGQKLPIYLMTNSHNAKRIDGPYKNSSAFLYRNYIVPNQSRKQVNPKDDFVDKQLQISLMLYELLEGKRQFHQIVDEINLLISPDISLRNSHPLSQFQHFLEVYMKHRQGYEKHLINTQSLKRPEVSFWVLCWQINQSAIRKDFSRIHQNIKELQNLQENRNISSTMLGLAIQEAYKILDNPGYASGPQEINLDTSTPSLNFVRTTQEHIEATRLEETERQEQLQKEIKQKQALLPQKTWIDSFMELPLHKRENLTLRDLPHEISKLIPKGFIDFLYAHGFPILETIDYVKDKLLKLQYQELSDKQKQSVDFLYNSLVQHLLKNKDPNQGMLPKRMIHSLLLDDSSDDASEVKKNIRASFVQKFHYFPSSIANNLTQPNIVEKLAFIKFHIDTILEHDYFDKVLVSIEDDFPLASKYVNQKRKVKDRQEKGSFVDKAYRSMKIKIKDGYTLTPRLNVSRDGRSTIELIILKHDSKDRHHFIIHSEFADPNLKQVSNGTSATA